MISGARQFESGNTPGTTGITRELFGIKMSKAIFTGAISEGVPCLDRPGKWIGKAVTIFVGHHDGKHVKQS